METKSNLFDYAAFIYELRALRDSYANPPLNHRNRESLTFKEWRHHVSDLIERMGKKGYDINCRISQRQFRVMSSGPTSPHLQQKTFDNAHAETMIELNTIISNFEKYGDPKATPLAQALETLVPLGSAQKEPLKFEKEATLSWYFKNTPVGTLWKFGGVSLAVISAAFYGGMTKEKLWPEAKPSAIASQPASAALVVQTQIGGQTVNNPTVQAPLNGLPVSGQGASSSKVGR